MFTKLSLPTQQILDVSITALGFNEYMQTIIRWAQQHQTKNVCVANVHMLMEAHWNREFAHILEDADIVTPDGMPLVWMMRRRGLFNQERVAGLDILRSLCQLAQAENVSVFFVGSQREILESMRKKLKQEFPWLKIAGMEPLPFLSLNQVIQEEDQEIIQKINKSDAGVVFVSLGCPKQEYWMARYKGKIKAVMIGLGGAFPVYGGIRKRAPAWVRNLGCEWLVRLAQDPKKLARRYFKTNTIFILMVLKRALLCRCAKNINVVVHQSYK